MKNIVSLPLTVDHVLCESLLEQICRRYPAAKKAAIGYSVQGRALTILKIGSGDKKILYVGTHHAMEHITSSILLRFSEEACKKPPKSYTFYILPMLNPDGVALHLSGGIYANWQANARGVDLNHNYNAKWQEAKDLEPSYDVIGPCASRFGGTAPETEPETAALCRFVRELKFTAAIAFHTQGEEIYYEFCGNYPQQSLHIANIMGEMTGYQVCSPEGIASYGGFKDWCIEELGIPAFTVELGLGKNPLPESDAPAIYRRLRKMLFSFPRFC